MDRARPNSLSNPLWAISGLGAELFGAIAGMGVLGWLIDRFVVGSGQTWLFVGLAIGIIGGGYNFIRQALHLNRKAAAEYKQGARSRPARAAPPPLPPVPKAPGAGWFESSPAPDDDDPSSFPGPPRKDHP